METEQEMLKIPDFDLIFDPFLKTEFLITILARSWKFEIS